MGPTVIEQLRLASDRLDRGNVAGALAILSSLGLGCPERPGIAISEALRNIHEQTHRRAGVPLGLIRVEEEPEPELRGFNARLNEVSPRLYTSVRVALDAIPAASLSEAGFPLAGRSFQAYTNSSQSKAEKIRPNNSPGIVHAAAYFTTAQNYGDVCVTVAISKSTRPCTSVTSLSGAPDSMYATELRVMRVADGEIIASLFQGSLAYVGKAQQPGRYCFEANTLARLLCATYVADGDSFPPPVNLDAYNKKRLDNKDSELAKPVSALVYVLDSTLKDYFPLSWLPAGPGTPFERVMAVIPLAEDLKRAADEQLQAILRAVSSRLNWRGFYSPEPR